MIHIVLNYTVCLQVERICVENCLKLVLLVSVVCSLLVSCASLFTDPDWKIEFIFVFKSDILVHYSSLHI